MKTWGHKVVYGIMSCLLPVLTWTDHLILPDLWRLLCAVKSRASDLCAVKSRAQCTVLFLLEPWASFAPRNCTLLLETMSALLLIIPGILGSFSSLMVLPLLYCWFYFISHALKWVPNLQPLILSPVFTHPLMIPSSLRTLTAICTYRCVPDSCH